MTVLFHDLERRIDGLSTVTSIRLDQHDVLLRDLSKRLHLLEQATLELASALRGAGITAEGVDAEGRDGTLLDKG